MNCIKDQVSEGDSNEDGVDFDSESSSDYDSKS